MLPRRNLTIARQLARTDVQGWMPTAGPTFDPSPGRSPASDEHEAEQRPFVRAGHHIEHPARHRPARLVAVSEPLGRGPRPSASGPRVRASTASSSPSATSACGSRASRTERSRLARTERRTATARGRGRLPRDGRQRHQRAAHLHGPAALAARRRAAPRAVGDGRPAVGAARHVPRLAPRAPPRSRRACARASRACAGHPAVLGYLVGNEIPASIVRWHGRGRVERFLERLRARSSRRTPAALVSYVELSQHRVPRAAAARLRLLQRLPRGPGAPAGAISPGCRTSPASARS